MQKFKLIKDGQIVGYERVISGVTTRSYDNQVWAETLNIPCDSKKQFLTFDQNLLVEVYEA